MKPKFQQRHYETIAEVMQRIVSNPEYKAETRAEYRERVIRELCRVFVDDNPNFKEDRFRVACVPGNDILSRRVVGPAMPYYKGNQ